MQSVHVCIKLMCMYCVIHVCSCATLVKEPTEQLKRSLEDDFNRTALSEGASETTSTTDDDSRVKALTEALKNLQLELQKRDRQLAEMKLKIEHMEKDRRPAGDGDSSDEDDGPSSTEQAVKQRLRRMCRKRKNGSLIVPVAVYEAWKNPGPSRDNLIKVYIKNGCKKDPCV